METLIHLRVDRVAIPEHIPEFLLDDRQPCVIPGVVPTGGEIMLTDPIVRIKILKHIGIVEERDQWALPLVIRENLMHGGS